MTRARTITYAPLLPGRSRRNARACSENAGAWTLCRKLDAFPVRDGAMLRQWTERGRVRPDDYLVSRERELCVQARDVAELDAVFRRTRADFLRKVCRALACAALLLVWLEPLAGAIIFGGAIAAASASWRTVHRRQNYLHSIG